MEIIIGNLVLASEYASIGGTRIGGTRIIIKKGGDKIADIGSEELKAAIEALEKSCWRP